MASLYGSFADGVRAAVSVDEQTGAVRVELSDRAERTESGEAVVLQPCGSTLMAGDLPSTGGIGRLFIYLSGGLILLATLIYGVVLRRKKGGNRKGD